VLTVTGATVTPKIYDGTTNATITGATLSGVISGDSVSLGNATSGFFMDKNVGIGISVTTTMTISGSDSGNYQLTQPTLTGSISKATLTVTANNASRSYGVTNPVFTASYSGFANGETNTAFSGSPSLTTVATTTTIAGSYPITVTNGTLSATNYTFNFVNGILTITNLNGIVDPAALQTFLGNGIVDQADLGIVLAHYWTNQPPAITNFSSVGNTNFTFSLANFTFEVEVSHDLINWTNLGQLAVFQFTDTNSYSPPTNSYYRLVTMPPAP